jgi:hypothetical protein
MEHPDVHDFGDELASGSQRKYWCLPKPIKMIDGKMLRDIETHDKLLITLTG